MGRLQKRNEMCDETKASYFSKLTFRWLNRLLSTGFRAPLTEEDVGDLPEAQKARNVVPRFLSFFKQSVQLAQKRCRSAKHRSQDQKPLLPQNRNVSCDNSDLEELAFLLQNDSENEEEILHFRASLLENVQDNGEKETLQFPPSSLQNGQDSHRACTSLNQNGGRDYKKMRHSRGCFAALSSTGPRNNNNKTASLFRVFVRTFWKEALCIQVWQLAHDVFMLTNPLVLGLLIDFIQDGTGSTFSGCLYSSLLFLSMTFQAVTHIRVYHLSGCLALKIRTATMSAVFRKALTMDAASRQESTVGEVVNLMSADAEHLEHTATWLYELWSGPLKFFAAMLFIYVTLGAPMLAGLAVTLLFIPINMVVLRYLRACDEKTMELKDTRLKILNEVLNGIKILKMYAWEPSFFTKINGVREKELGFYFRRYMADIFLHLSWTVTPFVILLSMFLTYVYTSESHYLSPKTAFVSMGFMEVVRMAINMAPVVLSDVIKATVSFRRLERYLNHRDLDRDNVVRQAECDGNGQDDEALRIEDGTFSWSTDLPPTLKDVALSVSRGSLVAVVGVVGAGKSSLLSALLGEMEIFSGKVKVKGSVAYVPQQAWIQHDTLRDNILFGKPLDQDFYDRCNSACALTADLDILPGGDMTEIGERGINLSGGQKQRVSLARAVYSERDIYLLDDPLSAVDIHVGMHIFDKVVGHKGLLAGKTRILVTHGIQWLPYADFIIMMKAGRVVETGAYNQLLSHNGPFTQYLSSCLNQDEPEEEKNDPEVHEFRLQVRQRLESLHSNEDKNIRDIPHNFNVHNDLHVHNTTNFSNIPAVIGVTDTTVDNYQNKDTHMTNQSRKNASRSSGSAFSGSRTSRSRSPDSMTPHETVTEFGRFLLNDSLGLPEEKSRKSHINEGHSYSRTKENVMSRSSNLESYGVKGYKGSRTKDDLERNTVQKKHVLVEEETVENQEVKWSAFVALAKALGLAHLVVMILSFVLYHAAVVMSDVFLSRWTDDPDLANFTALPANSTERMAKNHHYLAFYGGFGLLQVAALVAYSVLKNVRMVNASRVLHNQMLTRILHAPMVFFDTTPVGRIVNRFSHDITTIDGELPYTFSGSVESSCLLLSSLVVVSFSTPWFLLALGPLMGLYVMVQRFYIPTSRQLKRLETKSRSPIYSFFGETLMGASVVRAYGAQRRFVEEVERRVDENTRMRFNNYCTNRWLGIRMNVLAAVSVLITSVSIVTLHDVMPPGLAGLVIVYAMSMTGIMNFFMDSVSNLELHVISIERVQEYVNILIEAPWRIREHTPRRSWPEVGEVKVNKLDIRYRDGLDLVLNDVTFHLTGGEKVGIVGRTGAGKSSLTLALFRLMEPAGGKIYIDGLDTATLGLHDLRSRLAILPQDPVIFSGSLRMNLDPFSRFGDAELWSALEHAYLKAFVSSLPDMLQYECGEGGENLSVGQRQLLCLARTLLHKTKILVLDEATAAVDMETDDLIQQTLRTEFADCTVLTIAHRINTVMDYDNTQIRGEE